MNNKTKKRLRYGIFFVLAGVVIFFIMKTTAGVRQKDKADALIQNLPSLTVYSLNGAATNIQELSNGNATVVIYFSPDCEYCQYEATELKKNITSFHQVQIIMITRSGPDEIRTFEKSYGLSGISFIHFLWDRDNLFPKTFGTMEFPSIFIYNKDHKLVKRYIGETKTEAILKDSNR